MGHLDQLRIRTRPQHLRDQCLVPQSLHALWCHCSMCVVCAVSALLLRRRLAPSSFAHQPSAVTCTLFRRVRTSNWAPGLFQLQEAVREEDSCLQWAVHRRLCSEALGSPCHMRMAQHEDPNIERGCLRYGRVPFAAAENRGTSQNGCLATRSPTEDGVLPCVLMVITGSQISAQAGGTLQAGSKIKRGKENSQPAVWARRFAQRAGPLPWERGHPG